MSLGSPATARPFGRKWLPLLVYSVALAGIILAAVLAIANLLDAHEALDKNRVMLARLDQQKQRASRGQAATSAAVSGPPFLVGKTITIAGAALQERVDAAVRAEGGNVLSSQIDLQGPRSVEGFVDLTESVEIGQAALQPLLYDLEAGMPYLFVENLAIQAPQAFGEAEGTPMRVLMVVSGQWQDSQ